MGDGVGRAVGGAVGGAVDGAPVAGTGALVAVTAGGGLGARVVAAAVAGARAVPTADGLVIGWLVGAGAVGIAEGATGAAVAVTRVDGDGALVLG